MREGARDDESQHREGAEEDGATCRICLVFEDDSSKLSCPCACKGTLQYVHEACLFGWIDQSKATRCEVCKMCYVVSNVYRADAPTSLPIGDVVIGLVRRLKDCFILGGRLVLVFTTWLVAVPLITTSFFRLAFARSLRQYRVLICSRALHPALVVFDCVNGCFLSLSVIFLLTGISTLRAYVKQLLISEDDTGDGAADGHVAGAEDVPPRVVAADDYEGVDDDDDDDDDDADDDDGDDDGFHAEEFDAFDDLTLEQLIGLRGPLSRLFEHAATLATSNALFILVAAFFPFNFGSGVIQLLKVGRNFTNPRFGHLLLRRRASGGAGGVVGNGMALGVVSWLGDLVRRVLLTTGEGVVHDSHGHTPFIPLSFTELEAQMAPPPLADIAILGLGYVTLGAVGISWLLMLSVIRVLRRGHSINPDSRIDGANVRFIRHALVVVKVVLLLGFDLILFPALCGWWVDLNTLSLFESSVNHRLAFHAATPVMCTAIHWGVGLVYIVSVAVVISMIREIMHPEVLAFIRDPADPNYNPLQELVRHPLLFWHVRRIAFTTLVYGAGVVIMIYAPVALSRALMPAGFFPLRFVFPEVVGIEQLVLHFFAPFVLEHANPKKIVKWLFHGWMRWSSTKLRLSNYLIPEEEGGAAAAAAVRRDQQLQENVGTTPLTLTLHISELHGGGPHVDDELVVKVGVSADLDLPWTDPVSSLTYWAAQLVGVPPTKMTVLNRGGTVLREAELMYACIPQERCSSQHVVLEIKFQSFGTRPGGLILVYNRARESDETARATEHATSSGVSSLCVRVTILIVSSWTGYCLASAACVVGPIAVGRGLFDSIGLALYNDAYTLTIGACVIAGTTIGTAFFVRRLHNSPLTELGRVFVDVSVAAIETVAIALAWLLVVPLLLGLLFELLVLKPLRPSQVPHAELVLLWVVGLLLLKAWFRMTTAGLAAPEWATALRRLQQEGFETPFEVSMAVLVPFIGGTTAAIVLPFLSFAVCHVAWMAIDETEYHWKTLPLMEIWDQPAAQCVHLHAAVLLIAVEVARRVEGLFYRLQYKFRDDEYLVGRRLVNFQSSPMGGRM